MYEYLQGKLAELAPTYAVVDVSGVGYMLAISLQTYAAIEGHTDVKLYTHFAVREDAQVLFGFSTKAERELFRHLISVSGVGGNTARMILSTYSPRELQSIITTENAVLLKGVKGLGLKTAQKIIVELSGKLTTLFDTTDDDTPLVVTAIDNKDTYDESLAALTMLGFPKAASDKTLRAILKEQPDISVEEAVRTALKRL
jgi:Holliday junction DNA helicase RuvA